MGTWIRDFFNALAAVSVTGVTTNFDLDEIPDSLSDAMLPCLIPDLLTTGSGSLEPVSFEGGVHALVLECDHILVLSSLGSEEAIMPKSADLAVAADNYITAMMADPFLGGKSNFGASFNLRGEVFEYAGIRYAAMRFRVRAEW